MVLMPEPIFAAVERVRPPRPLFLLGPGGRRLDQALAADLAATERLLPPVRSLRGRRRAGPRPPRRRRAVDRRLRAGRGRGRGDGGHRGRGSAGARGDGQRPLGGRGILRRRAPRASPVHAPRRVPRLGGPRRAAERGPRTRRAVASGAVAGPDHRAAPRPDRGARRPRRRRPSAVGRVRPGGRRRRRPEVRGRLAATTVVDATILGSRAADIVRPAPDSEPLQEPAS